MKKNNKTYNGKTYFLEIKRKEKNKERLNNEIDKLKDELNKLKNKCNKDKNK